MTAKFFGQFLLERGELDELQLRIALDLMEHENQTLGELAVAQGFASVADCRRVHGEQRRKDLPWGELAVQMGVLNRVELEELLQLQRKTRLPLSGALARLEVMTPERARELYDAFKSEQGDVSAEPSLPGSLTRNRAATATVQLFTRLLLRVGGIEARMDDGRPLERVPEGVLVATLPIAGLHGLRVTLGVDPDFGEKLAAALLGIGLNALAKELALEAVGEFLNVLAGNAISLLDEEALQLRLEPPCYGVLPDSGWCFDVATEGNGSAQLILELPCS